MSKPSFKVTRSIRSEQVLNAFVEQVLKNLPFKRFSKKDSDPSPTKKGTQLKPYFVILSIYLHFDVQAIIKVIIIPIHRHI